MKQEYQLLHQEMLKDIQRCLQLDLPESENVEACFWIASDYWDKLKERIKNGIFNDEGDEIDFFRNVKPQFTSWMEYFMILSEGLLFVPEERLCAITYWEEEMKRFKRYCDKNHEFVSY